MNPGYQISFDDYFWLKSVGPKRLKKRQFRSKSNIRYCLEHNCHGPHFVVQHQHSFSGRVIKLDSRKKIKKFMSRKYINNVSSICYGFSKEVRNPLYNKSKYRGDDSKYKLDYYLESRISYLLKEKVKRNKHKYKWNDQCSICIGNMKGKVVKTTPCNHTFCKVCFDRLIEFHRENFTSYSIKCPLCRCDIFKGTKYVKNKNS